MKRFRLIAAFSHLSHAAKKQEGEEREGGTGAQGLHKVAAANRNVKLPRLPFANRGPRFRLEMNHPSSAASPSDWPVLPHDPVQELSENLWRVEGALPHFSMRRVMSVVRLQNGELVIHSAIAMDEAGMQRLEAWGKPSILLIPHGRHRMDAPAYKRRYPALRVFAPPAVLKKAREVVNVDGTFADAPLDPSLSLELLDGTGEAEAAMIVRSNDGVSIVLTEVVFDLEPARSALGRAAIQLTGFGPGPCVTPVVKFELVKDKAQLRQHLTRLAAVPELVRLIVGHSRMSVGAAARAALRQAAASI